MQVYRWAMVRWWAKIAEANCRLAGLAEIPGCNDRRYVGRNNKTVIGTGDGLLGRGTMKTVLGVVSTASMGGPGSNPGSEGVLTGTRLAVRMVVAMIDHDMDFSMLIVQQYSMLLADLLVYDWYQWRP